MALLAGILLVVGSAFLLLQFSVTYWKYCKLLLMQQINTGSAGIGGSFYIDLTTGNISQ